MSEGNAMAGRMAVVTGASGGIGRAVAVALAKKGARLCIVGRNEKRMAETVRKIAEQHVEPAVFHLDLTKDEDLQSLNSYLEGVGSLDILVHCAGIIYLNPMATAKVSDFDEQYAANVRAPYRLTQMLLDMLVRSRGQVVFINSSAGLAAKRPSLGQYAGTKHALKALADSLREEVNPKGVRVLSVYPGRTATPMQQAIHAHEGRKYDPKTLLQPEDVASVVMNALTIAKTAEVTDISIRPMIGV